MKARWLGLLVMTAAAACDDGGENVGGNESPLPGADGGIRTDSGVIALPDGGFVPSNPTDGGGGQPPAQNTSGLPCDVEAIVKAKCGLCHTDPPAFGASMALTKQAHFAAQSTQYAGSTYAQRVKVRVNQTQGAMPPVNQPQLTADEKAKLLAWIDSGAQTSTAGCTTNPGTPDAGAGPGPGTGNPDNIPYDPPDSECDYIFEMRAHGGQNKGDTSPFTAPSGGDHYEIFYFQPPWGEKVHITRIRPIIDNAAVLHHWLLYQRDSGGGADGSHKSDSGLQSSDMALLSGWAPGNDSLPIPKHVGLQTITSAGRYGIELHYNTSANPASRADRSGAQLCATKTVREHEASVHWLGTQAIFLLPGMGTATGQCTPQVGAGGVSHIIAHSPHMHKTGVHAKTTVKRKSNGMVETLWDAPFSFDDQQIFPVPNADREQLIYPGDVLSTTCTYNSTGVNSFGPGTNSEMCYNFVVAWPAGSLSNGIAGAVGGKNTCIDPGT